MSDKRGMAFFIKIKDQVYKIPDKTLVGRGEPFNVFAQNRKIDRAHMMFLYKKKEDKFYIKDVGSRSGTFLLGRKIKKNKFIQVNAGNKIKIGEEEIELIGQITIEDFVTIKKSVLPQKAKYIKPLGIMMFIYLAVASVALFFYATDANIPFSISALLITFALMFLPFYFLGKLLDTLFQSISIKEVYYDQDGFTIHYTEGGNMSFKLKEIQYWKANNSSITINIYDKEHHIKTGGESQSFNNYLNKNLKNKKDSTQKLTLLAPLLVLIVVMSSGLIYKDINIELMANASIILLAAIFLFNKSARRHWVIQISKSFSMKKQLLSIIAFASIGVMMGSNSLDRKKTLGQINACVTGDGKVCKIISMDSLTGTVYMPDAGVLSKICAQENPLVCTELKKQKAKSIASEKKKE